MRATPSEKEERTMTRFTYNLAAIGLTLMVAPAVIAGNDKNHKPAPYHSPTLTYRQPTTFPYAPQPYAIKNYHLLYGTPFKYGVFYNGIHDKHWVRVYYNPFYRCYVYVEPYTMVEYYWCPPANSYYPMTYMPYGTYQFGPGPVPPAAAGVAAVPAPADLAPKDKSTSVKRADTDDEDN
jgi:hypothetical protein